MLSVEEILAKLKNNSEYYMHVRKALRENKDFSILAVETNPKCYFEHSFLFRGDKDVNEAVIRTGNLRYMSRLVYSDELLKSDEEYRELKQISVEAGQRVGYMKLLGSIYSEHLDDIDSLTIGDEIKYAKKHFKNVK